SNASAASSSPANPCAALTPSSAAWRTYRSRWFPRNHSVLCGLSTPMPSQIRKERSGGQFGLLVDRHHGGAAEAEVVLEGGLGAVDLAVAGVAAQLPRELGALGQAGGAEGVALGDQAS